MGLVPVNHHQYANQILKSLFQKTLHFTFSVELLNINKSCYKENEILEFLTVEPV